MVLSPHLQREAATLSERLAGWLAAVGVELVFGVSGGGVAPLWGALSRASGLRLIHTQHESGAAFAAAEASLASGRPVAVFVTTGPGLTNALTGLVAARQEGARVLVLSGVTPASRRLQGATQGCGPASPLAALYTPGALFDLTATVESPQMLPPLLQRCAEGLGRPGGFVAHIGVPSDLQGHRAAVGPLAAVQSHPPAPPPAVLERLARQLAEKRVAIVAGFEARRAAGAVVALAERLGAMVVLTPRAKGVVPDGHPNLAGVVGFAGHTAADIRLSAWSADIVLVLGSRLGEGASQYSDALLPREQIVWIHPDPGSICGPLSAPIERITASVEDTLAALLPLLPASEAPALELAELPLPPPQAAHPGRVSPEALLDAVQRVVIDGGDGLVMAEAGNSFAWAIHRLRLRAPRLRVSVGWGAMGHCCTGLIGAALGSRRRAVALVGDGAMLMGHELATAARHGIPATWVVLNDSAYGMCRQGTDTLGITGVDCGLPPVDFAAFARSMGVPAAAVSDAAALDAALRIATTGDGPRLLDVRIDPSVSAPIGRRVQSLTWAAEEPTP